MTDVRVSSGSRVPKWLSFMRDDAGATALEYGMLVGMLSLGLLGAWTLVSGEFSNMFLFLMQAITEI